MGATEEIEQTVAVAPAKPIGGITSVSGVSSSITGLSKGASSSVTGLPSLATALPSPTSGTKLSIKKEEVPLQLHVEVIKKLELEDEYNEIKKDCTLNINSLHNIRPDLRDYVVCPNSTKGMEFAQRDGNQVKWDDTQYVDKVDGTSHTLKMQFDVSHYTPEDVKVVIADGILRILAMHEEKSDNQRTKRQYRREFLLPRGINPYQVSATISLDGVLTVEAPLPIDEVTDLDSANEKKPIPQTQTQSNLGG